MKWSWCVVMLAAAAGSACSRPATLTALPSAIPKAARLVRVGIVDGGQTTIRRVPLEEYVEATALSEFAPPAGDPAVIERMLEVQAVISRTYALAHLARHAHDGFDLCATTHCQLFQPSRLQTSRWAPQAAAAVRRTARTVLWYDAGPARALFHADCGGHTSNAVDVWGGTARPYLVGRADDGPAGEVHAAWRFEASKSAVLRALNADPRTRLGGRLDGIHVLDRDQAGRGERIALRGAQERVVRGEVLREVLAVAFGGRAIKSTWFDVRPERALFVFEGRGFGHGVGLCQAGALARIRAGAKPAAILQRYFPGTRLIALS
jgi:stage II sporulation protein D